jgi:hypothetical protein
LVSLASQASDGLIEVERAREARERFARDRIHRPSTQWAIAFIPLAAVTAAGRPRVRLYRYVAHQLRPHDARAPQLPPE